MVSNGKQVMLKPYAVMPVFKEEATLATPRNLHGMLTTALNRMGVMNSVLGMAYLVSEADMAADPGGTKLDTWEFNAGRDEKVGGHEAKVVSFRAGIKETKDAPAVTVWIDSKTLLPLKRVIVSKSAGTLTEEYSEFTLDPKIGAKAFELPK
jgi:outer membrane lipoprotein-sorting protein